MALRLLFSSAFSAFSAFSAVSSIWLRPKAALCLSSNRASFVNSYSSVRVRPGAPFHGGHGVISSIVPCEGAGDGANPFGHPNFDGPLIVGYPPLSGGCSLIARERPGEIPRGAGSSPANWSPSANVVFLSIESFRRAVESGLSAKAVLAPQAGSNPVQPGNWLTTQLASCPSFFSDGPLCFGYRTG